MRLTSLVLLTALGCRGPSAAPVTMTGEARSVDGGPLAFAKLRLDRAGSACNTISSREVLTDEQGRYRFEPTPEELSAMQQGVKECFMLVLAGPRGSQLFAEVLLPSWDGGTALEGPALQQWSGDPKLVVGSNSISVKFDDRGLPPPEPVLDTNVLWAETPDGGLIWDTSSSRPEMTLFSDMLEDYEQPHVYASISRTTGGNANARWSLHWRSEPAVLPRGTHVPASRGAPCSFTAAPPGACRLTDGELSQVVFGVNRQVTLSLSAPRTLRSLVVRGLRYLPSRIVFADDHLLVRGDDGGVLVWTPARSGNVRVPVVPQPVSRLSVSVVDADGGPQQIIDAAELSFFE